MSNEELLLIIFVGGIGTYLTRLLPLLSLRQRRGAEARHGWRRALDAIGPAAIVSLLATAVWGMVSTQADWGSVLPLLAGVVGVVVGKRWMKTIAAATIIGVLAYGCTVWLISG